MRRHFAWPQWSGLDTLLLIAITGLAAGLRGVGISQPRAFVFDEFYVADACLYAFGPEAFCLTETEISIVHPPLGKWLIAAGLQIFGFNSTGWRAAALIAGTLTVAILYVLARRLLASSLAALLAAGLLAFDFLHFVMSRTAMFDIFVLFFGLLAFLCLSYDDARPRSRPTGPLGYVADRRWLFAAGAAGGAAIACKWSGLYLFACVALLAIGSDVSSRRFAGQTWSGLGTYIVALGVVPALVYVASYAGRLEGTLLAWPWQDMSWLRAFGDRQQQMLAHHLGPLYVHPYMSEAWSWPFVRRPVLFYFRELGSSYEEILAIGNPLIWWSALVALVVTAARMVTRTADRWPGTVIVAGFSAGYVPWLLITRSESFLYYLLPAIPFMYLALAGAIAGLSTRVTRSSISLATALAAVGMFSFFHPVLVGSTLSYEDWQRRMLFNNCAPRSSAGLERPQDKPTPPPAGWCWV